MSDLFEAAPRTATPLADRMRPSALDEIVGQRHILGPGKVLRRKVEAGRIGAVVLYGPSGVGKTTIAQAIGRASGREFHRLHPNRHKTEDIRRVAEHAKAKPILLFVDEIHRFNVGQQDQMLEMTETGLVDFMAATTENPQFGLSKAMVSRATVLRLMPLGTEEIAETLRRIVVRLAGEGRRVTIEPEALRCLSGRPGGDARRAVNALEDVLVGRGEEVHVTLAMAEEAFEFSPIAYDRRGDDHYDVVSAFVKSMRGSDPDATLYWLARLIHCGEDPRYIARRILVHASEDVGLADPSALQTAVAALQAVEHVGYPEARITLAHAALHVARAPKSNSAYRGINLALEAVEGERPIPVPANMRDSHYGGAEALGAKGYLFPHADPSGWVDQVHAPGVEPGDFYRSDARGGGSFERRADDYWAAVTGRPQPRYHEEG